MESPSDDREHVAVEEHLNCTDFIIVGVSPEKLLKGFASVDTEAGEVGHSKAAVVLVKGEVEWR